MHNQIIFVAIAAVLIGGLSGYIIADSTRTSHSCGGGMGMEEGKPMEMCSDMMMKGGHAGMGNTDHMDHMMAMMVSSEREFIEDMIPHHLEAVETAKEVIARGGATPEVRELVENIVFAQEKEIAAMKEWYKAWYQEEYVDTNSYVPMMRDLQELSGVALDRAFLEDMIGHHMGAIMMARSVEPYIEHNEMAELTKAIISTQSAEIAHMRQMLQGL